MVKKEVFVKAINKLIQVNDVATALDNFAKDSITRLGSDFFELYGPFTVLNDVVIDVLAGGDSAINDLLSWWCYECNFGRDKKMAIVWDVDQTEFQLYTVEKLYEYISENMI